MHAAIRTLLFGAFLISANPARGQFFAGDTRIDTLSLATGLDTPWEILWGPDDWIWFTERPGRVSRLNPESGEIQLLTMIEDVHEEGEAGLLGMALHPAFPEEPYVYLSYNYDGGSRTMEKIVRFTYGGDSLTGEQVLFSGIRGARTHNGSRLAFGADGMLYVTTGDSQDQSLPQDPDSPNGKVLRMDPEGNVPEDNPETGSLVWTLGHRNPQGLVFGPGGILYSSEHGPSNDDEINIIEKGRNYGWPDVEGFCDDGAENDFCEAHDVREPIVAWTPTLAVAGLDYYDHVAIPEWQNCLLLTTLKNKTLIQLRLSGDGRSIVSQTGYLSDVFGRLRDICISPDGRVFLATSNRDGNATPGSGDDRIVELRPEGIASGISGTIQRKLEIFPNPATDRLMIRMTGLSGKKTILIYSLEGILMRTHETMQNLFECGRDDLPDGFYIVVAGDGRSSLREPLIIR